LAGFRASVALFGKRKPGASLIWAAGSVGKPNTQNVARKKSNASKGAWNFMMLIKIMMLAASVTIALGYLVSRSEAQHADVQSRGQKERGFDRQISENARQMMDQGNRSFATTRSVMRFIGPTN
jgi:hypothetical protein